MLRNIIIGLITVSILAIGGILWYVNGLHTPNKIYEPIQIDGIAIGGLTPEQAKEKLHSQFYFGNLILIYEDNKWEYPLADMGFEYNIDRMVNEAFLIGHSGNYFQQSLDIIELKLKKNKQLNLSETARPEVFKPIVEDIANHLNSDPLDASISIDQTINITPSYPGYQVNQDSLLNRIQEAIVPSKDIVVEIPLDKKEPQITAEFLKQINGIIGSYSTKFNNHIPGRNHNIQTASQNLDDILLFPGQTFSFNEMNGPITLEAGYVNAPVIVKGVLQEGIGGGVCQVSSTLYNAVALSGLDITDRRNHSIPSGYVPIGRDAVISYNGIDFKFQNNEPFPVYLKSYVKGNQVFIDIYGDTNRKQEIRLDSEIVKVIPRTIKYIDDPSLPKGKEVVEERGRDKIVSVTYMIIDGKRNVLSRDTYPSANKVIRRGTGEPVIPENQPLLEDVSSQQDVTKPGTLPSDPTSIPQELPEIKLEEPIKPEEEANPPIVFQPGA